MKERHARTHIHVFDMHIEDVGLKAAGMTVKGNIQSDNGIRDVESPEAIVAANRH